MKKTESSTSYSTSKIVKKAAIFTILILVLAVFAFFSNKSNKLTRDKITVNITGILCGTIDGIPCAEGYECVLEEPEIEDGAGYCVKMKISPTRGPIGDISTKEKCENEGGTWGRWGLDPSEFCQIPSKDFDRDCTDGSECQYGNCINYEEKVPGKCQKFPQLSGCLSYIEDGRVATSYCVD